MINFDNFQGLPMPPASDEDLRVMITGLRMTLPNSYLYLLRDANGIRFDSGAILYDSRQLVERNATFETAKYVPGMLAIGDDGGGKLFLLQQASQQPNVIYAIDSGALGAAEPIILSDSIENWVNEGFPVSTFVDTQTPEFADVYLVQIPDNGAKSFIGIKTILGIDISLSDFKRGSEKLPFRLLDRVPFGKYQKRAEKVNQLFGDCLELKASK